jgi:hypothetical protein
MTDLPGEVTEALRAIRAHNGKDSVIGSWANSLLEPDKDSELQQMTAAALQNHVSVVKAACDWVDLARKFRYGPDWKPSTADVMKSSLLTRLLSGKDPLALPPPKKYAYPWYSLVENGYEFFASELPDGTRVGLEIGNLGTDYKVICHDPAWRVVDSAARDSFHVTYHGEDHDLWMYRPLRAGGSAFAEGKWRNPVTDSFKPIPATHVFERVGGVGW